MGLALALAGVVKGHDDGNQWVDLWASMPQEVEPHNLPPTPFTGDDSVYSNTTIRQTIYLTQSAPHIRLSLSNEFGGPGADLHISAVTIALPFNGTAGSSSIQPKTLREVTFSGGSRSFAIPNGAVAISDPIKNVNVKAESNLAVTIYIQQGQQGKRISGHPGSRTSSWFVNGDHTKSTDLTEAVRVDRWFVLSAVAGWVEKKKTRGSLVIVGDSITDGRGSTTNGNDRWPDQLLRRLEKQGGTGISVINQAAGGNRVLADGLGPNALGRIGRDVLAHNGVKYVIVFEGVNDLGTAAEADLVKTGDRLIQAYEQIVARLHGHGIAVFGATITPMSGPGQAYGEPKREEQRLRVNRWIRSSKRFDAVIDFDRAVRDPKNETRLNPEYDTGDYLHLNPTGYKAMAEAVDLRLLERFKDGVSSIV
ncbi:SGNH hydrolase-type esterase domain-containing protein [Triangularia verruculosa]|uniref:SGNH hydrolase-type esterase domain-containing protein n=1 Tax=Triangularia verruculosa TaxID=2587418 RepID=A0AAN6XF37_9PEZI|nr:SGNH hydrolase-type esterase domain-containing protein [Triangularia verruculosa]